MRTRCEETRHALWAKGDCCLCAGHHTYIGLLTDNCVNWRPAVKTTLARCRCLPVALRKLQGILASVSPHIMSKPHYVWSALCVTITTTKISEWQLEVFHRSALRLRLGLSSYAPNPVTLVEAQDAAFSLRVEECVTVAPRVDAPLLFCCCYDSLEGTCDFSVARYYRRKNTQSTLKSTE